MHMGSTISNADKHMSFLTQNSGNPTHDLMLEDKVTSGRKSDGNIGSQNVSVHVQHDENPVPNSGHVNMNSEEMSSLGQASGDQTHELMLENVEKGSIQANENVTFEDVTISIDVNCEEISFLAQDSGDQALEAKPGNLENGDLEANCVGFEVVDNEMRKSGKGDVNIENISSYQNSAQPNHGLDRDITENGSIEDNVVAPDFENIGIHMSGEENSLGQNPVNQTNELKSENMENESKTVDSDTNVILNASGKKDVNNEVAKTNSKPARKKKVVAHKKGKKYPLRSSLGSSRVLRSRPKTTSNTQPESVTNPVNPITKTKKRRRKAKKVSNDEFLSIRKRIRYLLTRMSYEQILINAYCGDGWKGQSAEKIRPEKEMERAKSEILRCKFRIREMFQRLDSLSSEGRLDESLFDSEGEIDSEDIFCAKCGSKDSSINNDILLCDGTCDRGFHQKCLNPPLLTADIPQDDGWLCPACDCRVDCIDLVNDCQGNDISIEDTWEKVFPEAVAISNGDKQFDGLPSDDSEDYDYNPDGLADDDVKGHNEESEPEDSDFSKKNQIENNRFPSDDSEDDEFDPDTVDFDKNIQKDKSSSDESDFTSDSDEFCAELSKASGANKRKENNSGLLSTLDSELKQENVLESGKRQVERLDYKKLYDETYKKSSSDSSDDEDWTTSNRRKKHASKKESKGPSTPCTQTIKRRKAKVVKGVAVSKEPNSSGNNSSASKHGALGETVRKRLYESFQENQYPTRATKESLAQELGLRYEQVNKWFGNCRHSFNHSGKKVPPNGVSSPNKANDISNRKITRGSKERKRIDAVQKSTDNGNKRKQKNADTEHENDMDADNMSDVDMGRHKAIARELKKMKVGR